MNQAKGRKVTGDPVSLVSPALAYTCRRVGFLGQDPNIRQTCTTGHVGVGETDPPPNLQAVTRMTAGMSDGVRRVVGSQGKG